jgi:TetR/AcrR family transcriptional regulator, cholesterol catabolism regulator
VAAEVMCQKGYEATSMNDIANAVGLTKAGLYHYIRGKEDLLFQIMSYGMDMVDQDVIAPAKQVEDPTERLRTIISRHSKRIIDVGGAVSILLDEMYALTPAHRRAIKARKRSYFELIRETLEQLAAEGRLRDLSPTVATFCLFGMLIWVARWYRKDGELSAELVLNDLLEAALNSVLKDAAGSARVESPVPLKRAIR